MNENKFDRFVLGLNLKHLRKQKRLKQGELCDIIGIKTTTLSNYETGFSTPDLETIVKFSKYFEVSLDKLCLIPEREWGDYPETSIINENRGTYSAKSSKCDLCPEKDRTIDIMKLTIELLRDKNKELQSAFDSIKSDLKSTG